MTTTEPKKCRWAYNALGHQVWICSCGRDVDTCPHLTEPPP